MGWVSVFDIVGSSFINGWCMIHGGVFGEDGMYCFGIDFDFFEEGLDS